MIVITRNGETKVISGWRAWLLGTSICAVTILVLGLVFFLMLGIALTTTMVLLITIPIVVGVALIASLFRRPGG
jgi:hypothetical protein